MSCETCQALHDGCRLCSHGDALVACESCGNTQYPDDVDGEGNCEDCAAMTADADREADRQYYQFLTR